MSFWGSNKKKSVQAERLRQCGHALSEGTLRYVKLYSQLGFRDRDTVGLKNAALAEMSNNLSNQGIRVPDGYAITTAAYHYFLESNQLVPTISSALKKIAIDDLSSLRTISRQITDLVTKADFPEDLAEEIDAAYITLERKYGSNVDVAVRSSSTVEGLPSASFAGQQTSCLNVRGPGNLMIACQQVFASLFSERAIAYCLQHDLEPMDIGISIGIQKMVRSDLSVSGVMATLDVQTGFRDVITISSSYGLGENIAQGVVNPDEFTVFKPLLTKVRVPILKRYLGGKAVRMVYQHGGNASTTRNEPVLESDQASFSLSDEEIGLLARQGRIIEEYCFGQPGSFCPMEIEWAKDGEDGKIYIVQARRETTHLRNETRIYQDYQLLDQGWFLVGGKSVGHSIVTGTARVIHSVSEINKLQPGEILVTPKTGPDWEPALSHVAAIVTDSGGPCCHAATTARELKVPAVVGCGDATQVITTGDEITVVCIERDRGQIYDGKLAYKMDERVFSDINNTETQLMLNLSNPEDAFEYAALPVAGVGLVKMEYIINHLIKVHPRALLEYEGQTPDVQFTIDGITAGYPDRRSYYIKRLAEGLGTIAAAFYPRPVMVRLSDFQSNEYAALYGGDCFESNEENPKLGLRGAARYFSSEFADSFALECEAIRSVRSEMGLSNLRVIAPFVRTPEEGGKLLTLMAQHGLRQGENDLKVYLMCETPANVLLAEEFLQYFDGFSIGTDDLLQLTMGVDRGSSLFADIDERNRAVLKLIYLAIDACHRTGRYIGISGSAPSDYTEITRWLVGQGIGSISFEPHSYFKMQKVVACAESKSTMDDTQEFNAPPKSPLRIPA
ncbi:MAG: phosphoenolpyruvate synthase [Thiothrix sp.]|nr:MAG: phosphoenolpyruvate synthase [Thiothrix sp.]